MPPTNRSLNPKTLFELCVEWCAAILHVGWYVGEAQLLPPHLKNRILEVSTARGLVDEAILRALLHRDTLMLDLGEGVTVDDGLLRAVAAGRCPRLTVLDLTASGRDKDAVTAAGLLELFPAVGANLKALSLSRCLAVDDAVVAEVARCCPRLRVLDLGGCPDVGDASLVALGDLEGLVLLEVSGTKVSDLGLLALAEGGSRLTLKVLFVDNCPTVTESGLMAIHALCPNLVSGFPGRPLPDLRDIFS